jgi:hypothetical protein
MFLPEKNCVNIGDLQKLEKVINALKNNRTNVFSIAKIFRLKFSPKSLATQIRLPLPDPTTVISIAHLTRATRTICW